MIIVISDTYEGVYERALIRWQRVMSLKCFGLPTFLGENAKLTSVVICNGLSKDLVFIRKKISNLNDK
jgi:hypothetical protein